MRSGRVTTMMWAPFLFFGGQHCKYQTQEEQEEEEEEDMMELEVDWKGKQRDLFFSVCPGQMLLFLINLTDCCRGAAGHTMRNVWRGKKKMKRLK